MKEDTVSIVDSSGALATPLTQEEPPMSALRTMVTLVVDYVGLADVDVRDMTEREKLQLGTDEGVIVSGACISRQKARKASTVIHGAVGEVSAWLVEVPRPTTRDAEGRVRHEMVQVGVFENVPEAVSSVMALIISNRLMRFIEEHAPSGEAPEEPVRPASPPPAQSRIIL